MDLFDLHFSYDIFILVLFPQYASELCLHCNDPFRCPSRVCLSVTDDDDDDDDDDGDDDGCSLVI